MREPRRETWRHDVDSRQRSSVYPDTLANEVRFWRNLGSQRLSTTQKIGLAILAVFFGGFLVRLSLAVMQAGLALKVLVGILFLWGPIFAGIAWGTRKALRELAARKNKERN